VQQLARYEALVQLFEEIQLVDDLEQIARRVATQWKYFANVAAWRLAVVDGRPSSSSTASAVRPA
jgi:hypothetical protein